MPEPTTFDEFIYTLTQRERLLHMHYDCEECRGDYLRLLRDFLASREQRQQQQKTSSWFCEWGKERLISELRAIDVDYLFRALHSAVFAVYQENRGFDRVTFDGYRYDVIRRTLIILLENEIRDNENREDELIHELAKRFEGTYAGEILNEVIECHKDRLRREEKQKIRQHFDQLEAWQRKITKLPRKPKGNKELISKDQRWNGSPV